MKLSADDITLFNNQGYLFFPELFTKDEISKLQNEVPSILGRSGPEIVREKHDDKAARLAFGVHSYSESYSRMVSHPRMLEPVKQLLNDEVYLHQSRLNPKYGFGSGASWDWHQDFGHWYREGCLSPDMLSIGIALTPMNQDNGSLNFIRCSHKFGRIDHVPTGHSNSADPEYVTEALKRYEVVPCILNPGDAVVFHCNLLHGSGPNLTEKHRSLIMSSYNALENNPWKPIDQGHYSRKIEVLPDDKLIKGEWVSLMSQSTMMNLDGAEVYGYEHEKSF